MLVASYLTYWFVWRFAKEKDQHVRPVAQQVIDGSMPALTVDKGATII